ncbi:GvpL/GvpF family gas vesicle protein [Streptomyces sp. NPDC057486]|uniref:GvpL/GvpF family gas vesicle protein n=1 Tax=Streptomyces sp. NPDC057486 TaxID=3346145 RepID=UPI00368F95B2
MGRQDPGHSRRASAARAGRASPQHSSRRCWRDGTPAALEYFSEAVEANVKALPAQNALASLLVEDKKVWPLREDARRRPGYEASLRLGGAVAAALESRAAEVSLRVLRELTAMARAVAAGPDAQGCVFNVSFLVNRGASDDFRGAAERFGSAHREHIELSCGPAVLLQLRRRCRHSRAGGRSLTWD